MSVRRFVSQGPALAVCLAIGLLAASACGGGKTTLAPEFHDTLPLPEEPLVTTVPAVGRYGGRYVMGSISPPRTFNSIMASEVSSTDITRRMFVPLTTFDYATQRMAPVLAQSWEQGSDARTWT